MNGNSNTGIAINEKVTTPLQFSTGQVTSADGTTIGYRQIGEGPGLVLMHGGMRASQHYLRLAQELAGSFCIIIPDRRGRGLSGPPGDVYCLERELEDLNVVLQRSAARMLFGHSAGGFFALEAALKLPIDKLVLYEPAVSINGSLPLDWLPAFEGALDRSDTSAAMAIFFKGLQLHWTSKLPLWLLAEFSRLMLATEDGQEMGTLLPTGVWEIEEFRRMEQTGLTYERYRDIQVPTLLLGGSRSPDYLRGVLPALARVIPQSRVVELPGQGHNAPDQDAPEVVAAELKEFLQQ